MTPQSTQPDQFGRPALASATGAISATAAASISGSIWPTRNGSITAALDTTASACEPYREFIELGLERGRNAMAIYQDLVDEHGFKAAYNSVRRFVRKLRASNMREAHPVCSS
jgi:hypothetical protein